jgi:hypothetical protein
MHGPTCIFWANLTPCSRRRPPPPPRVQPGGPELRQHHGMSVPHNGACAALSVSYGTSASHAVHFDGDGGRLTARLGWCAWARRPRGPWHPAHGLAAPAHGRRGRRAAGCAAAAAPYHPPHCLVGSVSSRRHARVATLPSLALFLLAANACVVARRRAGGRAQAPREKNTRRAQGDKTPGLRS